MSFDNPATSNKRVHIAFAIPSLVKGGAGNVILALARSMVERGHRVDLVLFSGHFHYSAEIPEKAHLFVADDKPDQITKDNPACNDLHNRIIPIDSYSIRYGWLRLARALKWHPLVLPTKDKFQQACQMAGYIRQQRPDIIFPTLPISIVSILLAGHLIENLPPVVPIIQGTIEKKRKHKRLRYKALFPDVAKVVTVSNGVADSVHREIGVSPDKITTIYNPVVSPEIDVWKSKTPDHPWFADDGMPVILACGRLIELKGFSVLIKAFARLTERRQCRLLILGKGPQKKELEDLAVSLGLREKVSLPGQTDNPFAFMSRAALFVLSSRTEGLPTVLIEALACGCPCVSTDCLSGPFEILQAGEIGSLVAVGDDTALADAMLQTLDNPPEKQKLLDRAAYFSVERAAGMYENLIIEVVHQRRRNNSDLR